jgi:hypothetical protein
MKAVKFIGIGLVLLGVSGCGVYSFSAGGKTFSSVNVSPFDNDTKEFLLGDRLTDALVDAFIQDNTVQIKEPSQAEAILNGTVLSYRREAHTYDQQDNVQKYSVKVAVRVKVVKSGTDDTIWEKDFYAEGIYDANSETEEDGQSRVIALLTADILNQTTKSW